MNIECLYTVNTPSIKYFFLHGMGGNANSWKRDLIHFKNDGAISISLRGRGQSHSPVSSYSIDDYVSDIAQSVQEFKISNFVLVALSSGVPWAIDYALKNQDQLKALVLIDHAPVQIPVSEKWINFAKGDRNRPFDDKCLEGIIRDHGFKNYYPDLKKITVPIKVFYGEKDGSHLTKKDKEEYMENAFNIELIALPHSAHGYSNEDEEYFWSFLERL